MNESPLYLLLTKHIPPTATQTWIASLLKELAGKAIDAKDVIPTVEALAG